MAVVLYSFQEPAKALTRSFALAEKVAGEHQLSPHTGHEERQVYSGHKDVPQVLALWQRYTSVLPACVRGADSQATPSGSKQWLRIASFSQPSMVLRSVSVCSQAGCHQQQYPDHQKVRDRVLCHAFQDGCSPLQWK